jgi:hypothetical protein
MRDANNWFRPLRTMPWEECETCEREGTSNRLYQLEDDRNGAPVCFECASEFGFVRGIDG